jgi:hypothetical protein
MSNSNTFDLDLSKDDDLDQMASKIETYYKQDSSQKLSLSYNWEKNHLFLDGKQWLIFEGSKERGGTWTEFKPFPENSYIPQPVTNYCASNVTTLKGYLLKNKPRITVAPNTQTYEDKTAAMIAELVSEANWVRLKEDSNYENASSVLLAYGTVFKKDYWDNSFASSIKVPRMVEQPVMDPATGQPTGQTSQVPALDPQTGAPLFDRIPLGDLSTKVIEPYCVSLDPLAMDLHEARWIMESSIRPLSWIKENFGKTDTGYTNRVDEVKEEKSLPSSLRRMYQLKTTSGVKGFNGLSSTSSGGSSEMIENAAVVKEYYERPSEKFPQGRTIVVANGIPLYGGATFEEGEEQGDWHPYSECRWERVPGRFWGKSPLDDGTEIQKHINSIDSIIILTRKTQAIPQRLEVEGMIVNGQWTGQPGQRVKYRPGPNGEKPEIIPASGVDSQVWQERKQKVEDLKEIMGASDILKGDRPPGVTAASAIALLFEVATGKLAPMLDRWKNFIESSQKKQLKIIAKKYREPRPEFINLLVSKNSELTPELIRSFVGSDLHDNCNVIIEASSSIPKLKAAEHALLLELQQTGALNLNDPQNRQEFLNRLGITGFDGDYNKDANRARLENMQLNAVLQHPEKKPVVMPFDNHDVHLQVLRDRMKEPSWMDLPPEVQKAYLDHESAHMQAVEEAEHQQMIKAAMMGQPQGPPAGAQPPSGPPEPIRKGPGVDRKTQQMLGADLLGTAAGIGNR